MGREEDDVVLEEERVDGGGGGGERGKELGELVAVAAATLFWLGLPRLAFAGRNVDHTIPAAAAATTAAAAAIHVWVKSGSSINNGLTHRSLNQSSFQKNKKKKRLKSHRCGDGPICIMYHHVFSNSQKNLSLCFYFFIFYFCCLFGFGFSY